MDFVAVFPAPCALDHVDFLNLPGHAALGEEEGDGAFGELGDSLLTMVWDCKRHVGSDFFVIRCGVLPDRKTQDLPKRILLQKGNYLLKG